MAAIGLFAAERDQRRCFLWTPVLIGIGIAGYLSLPREPSGVAVHAVALVVAGLAVRRYLKGMPFGILAVVALLLAGLSLGKARVDSLSSPMLAGPLTSAVWGRVAAAETRTDRRPRIVLDRLAVERLAASQTPARLRVSLAPNVTLPPVGAVVSFAARIDAVPGPAAPGDYDPRARAFFDRIGGSGFVFGAVAQIAPPEAWRPAAAIAWLRSAIVTRLRAALSGDAGAVAAALLVGERGGLSETVVANLRDSGLAHILAISGLHMGLFAGTVFAAVRAVLSLSPALAQTQPLRKWAALAALVAGFFYLLISGGNVATVRAFIMAAILFSAILIDRPALSLRNLAIAAIVVLAIAPESVAEPGFQMSFAAAAALVAVWEAWRRRRDDRVSADRSGTRGTVFGLVWPVVGGLAAIALTTVIASLATAPVAAYHFQRLATYSLIGNLMAMPVVSLIIMPSGLVALAAMPFGLEGPALTVFGWGVDRLLDVAAFTAALPQAVRPVAALPPVFLVLCLGGLMWLCLWHTAIRYLGLLPVGAALAIGIFGPPPPDLIVDGGGRIVALRTQAGGYAASGGRSGSYTLDRWHQRAGLAPPARIDRSGVACDALGCLMVADWAVGDGETTPQASTGGSTNTETEPVSSSGAGSGAGPAPGAGRVLPQPVRIAHVRDPLAFFEDCRRAGIVVTPLAAPNDCAAGLVIDRTALAVHGAHAVRFDAGSGDFAVKTAYPVVRRPWHGPVSR